MRDEWRRSAISGGMLLKLPTRATGAASMLGLLFAPLLFSAETLFIATPLTSGEFTNGIEGPACDRQGNIYCVSYLYAANIAQVTPRGQTKLFVTLPKGSTGNGIRFDLNGSLFVADYTGHNILRIDSFSKKITVFAHQSAMNQPNDLAIASDGTLYASDPNWKNNTGQVWRITRDGKTHLEAADMGTTNGIEVSPDGHQVYVNESVQRTIWVFDRDINGALKNKRVLKKFDDFGFDGMRCDIDGNLYATRHGKGTVIKLSATGEVLREIDILGPNPTNICFGGKDGCTAYVTEASAMRLVQVRVDRPGLEWARWKR